MARDLGLENNLDVGGSHSCHNKDTQTSLAKVWSRGKGCWQNELTAERQMYKSKVAK